MPTGYTNCIKDGVTFEQFVWKCARAMGALVMMRDEPSNVDGWHSYVRACRQPVLLAVESNCHYEEI